MDAHLGSNKISLAQSYTDQSGLQGTAFTYDNALAVLALLACADRESVIRARRLGEALVYAQENDAQFDDGRLRQAYQASAFVSADGDVLGDKRFGTTGTSTRDMAWVGIALVALAERVGGPRYQAVAARVGEWIERFARVSGRPGGYASGVDAAGQQRVQRLTEDNIDLVAFFTKLAKLLGDSKWSARAAYARKFALSMWNPVAGFFNTGTVDSGPVGEGAVLAGIQSSAYLAMPAYARALEWTIARHAVTDHAGRSNNAVPAGLSFEGVAFSTAGAVANEGAAMGPGLPKPNRNGVWFEGTARLALATRAQGNVQVSDRLMASLALAQEMLGRAQTINSKSLPDRVGLVAASSPIDTGPMSGCFPYCHVGATAWYLLAARNVNPLR
ncbi:hypothetical protein JNUCC0626_48240 [Lentzea sp. JNUCC 0626]|uniref:hypothetical protein n=1 Tax=Lentzea sp. JNUCC 0626 TaxID=3367513 RepID=UPI003747DC71